MWNVLLGRMRSWVECAARWNVLLEIIETGDGPCLFLVGQGGRRCGVRIGQKQVNCRLDAAGGSPAELKRHSSARRVHGQARKPIAAHRIIRNRQKGGQNSTMKQETF